jgi:hypothetical protein
VVLTQEFEGLASQIARLHAHPSLRRVVLPYPLEGRPETEVRMIARDAFPRVLRSLGVTD